MSFESAIAELQSAYEQEVYAHGRTQYILATIVTNLEWNKKHVGGEDILRDGLLKFYWEEKKKDN